MHTGGAIRFPDGAVMFFEYDGTSDINLPALYKSREEMQDHWRGGEWVSCTCGSAEEVEMMNTYGSGSTYPGKACRNCMAIVEPISWDDNWREARRGLPDWNPYWGE